MRHVDSQLLTGVVFAALLHQRTAGGQKEEEHFCFPNEDHGGLLTYSHCCLGKDAYETRYSPANPCWDAAHTYESCCRPRRLASSGSLISSSSSPSTSGASASSVDSTLSKTFDYRSEVEAIERRILPGLPRQQHQDSKNKLAAPATASSPETYSDVLTRYSNDETLLILSPADTTRERSEKNNEPELTAEEALARRHVFSEATQQNKHKDQPQYKVATVPGTANQIRQSHSEYCWEPLRRLVASPEGDREEVQELVDPLRWLTENHNGGLPLTNVQLAQFCCARPHDDSDASCFKFERQRQLAFDAPGSSSFSSSAATPGGEPEPPATSSEPRDDGTFFGWNWPVHLNAGHATANQLRMGVKHADCCFPQLRKMLATPLAERPQWMLDAVDQDLEHWRRYYKKSLVSTPASDAQPVPPSTESRSRPRREVQETAAAASTSSSTTWGRFLQHPLQHYGNRTYSVVDPASYSVVDPAHPELCEIFIQWCPTRLLGRSCAGESSKKELLDWQQEKTESWQNAKLAQAWFIVARHSPVYDCEALDEGAGGTASDSEKKTELKLGVRFYQSLMAESLDLVTGSTSSGAAHFELPAVHWTRSVLPGTASDTALMLPLVYNFHTSWFRKYESEIRVNFVPWRERRPEFFFRGQPNAAGAHFNWTRLHDDPDVRLLELEGEEFSDRGVYFRRLMRDDRKLWAAVKNSVRETGDWTGTKEFLQKLKMDASKTRSASSSSSRPRVASDHAGLEAVLAERYQLAEVPKQRIRGSPFAGEVYPAQNSPRAVLARLAHPPRNTHHFLQLRKRYPALFDVDEEKDGSFFFDVKVSLWPSEIEFDPELDFASFTADGTSAKAVLDREVAMLEKAIGVVTGAEKADAQPGAIFPGSIGSRRDTLLAEMPTEEKKKQYLEAEIRKLRRSYERNFPPSEQRPPSRSSQTGQKVQLKDQFVYKYNFHDNVSTRDVWCFLAGQVLFRALFRYDSAIDTIFQPYEHYIPLRRDMKDFYEKLNFIVEHDAWAEKIAERGRNLALEVMNLETNYWYMHTLALKLGLMQGGYI